MDKLVIELPQVLTISTHSASPRTAAIEFTHGDKILTKEEIDSIMQKWIDHIKGLIPQTKFSIPEHPGVEWLESSKELAIAGRNAVERYAAMSGRNVPDQVIKNFDERISSQDDSNGCFKVFLFNVKWEIHDPSRERDICISDIDFHFFGSQPIAKVWEYDEKGDNLDSQECTWEDGVKLYVELGKKWLKQYAPEMELPLP